MTLQPPKAIVYVTRDIERAMGMEPKDLYFVVSNDSKYGREIQKKYPDNVWLVKDRCGALDTYNLLLLPKVQKIISDRKADVLVFQNTPRIERLAKEKSWKLLNPSALLAKEIEEKISQIKWLGPDAKLLPSHKVALVKNVKWSDKKFVLQFNHSHTGEGTYIIDTRAKLDELQQKFPDRECRVVNFINGPVFTINVVVSDGKILVSNPNYQITGLASFTDLPFSTIGNDFAMPHEAKYKKVYKETLAIAKLVGKKLAKSGWKGLFGVDIIFDEKTGRTYLLEINARQPASAVFESQLQKKADPGGVSIFEAHISALANKPGKPIAGKLTGISSGSQIVKRITKKIGKIDISVLRKKKFDVIEYENIIHNRELLRIQSSEGIMRGHGKLNDLGNFITSCIK
ncbi:MAG TPA: ATP-grasp domain-containing protein [Candidatus Paceibacterota bacterium]